MKYFIYFLIICFTMINCSKKNEPIIEENSSCIVGDLDKNITTSKIIGEWKLIKTKTYDSDYDYSNETIIYQFNSNGVMVVSGGNAIGAYPIGNYSYIFEKDYLSNSSNPNEPMIWLVKIDGIKWIHQSQNELMVIVNSYQDGSDLCFQKN